MRSTPKLAECQLIAMTGYAGPEARARSISGGFDEHLTKPFGIETLLLALGSVGRAHAVSV